MEILNTPCGPIRGVPGRVPGTVAYKGIHYATAGRWELPREVTHWDGVFDGSGYGHCSYQPRAFLHGIKECRGDQKVNCPQGQEKPPWGVGRPQILSKQNLSPQGEKDGYFPSENPKIKDFRRTSNARPYAHRKERSLIV